MTETMDIKGIEKSGSRISQVNEITGTGMEIVIGRRISQGEATKTIIIIIEMEEMVATETEDLTTTEGREINRK